MCLLLGMPFAAVWSQPGVVCSEKVTFDPLTRWPLKGNSEVHLHTPTKFGEDPSKDLGGVAEQTNRQTDKRCSIYSMIRSENKHRGFCYGYTLRVALNGILYTLGCRHSKFSSSFIVAGVKISELLTKNTHSFQGDKHYRIIWCEILLRNVLLLSGFFLWCLYFIVQLF